MATTIQITETTKQELEMLKKKEDLSTYDAVIQELLGKKRTIPKSMFGTIKSGSWTKADRMDFDHERDISA